MVNSTIVPWGTPSCGDASGAGLCVGPRMKFPSVFAGALAPSGKSFAVTYPGVLGSRVGGVGRAAGAGAAGAGAWAIAAWKPVIRVIENVMLRIRNMMDSSLRGMQHQ